MLAIGVCNIMSSFVSSMPVSGALSRGAVNHASGVSTTFGGIYTGNSFSPIFYLQFTDNTKHGKRKGNLLLKNEEISKGKAHTNTRKLNQNISTDTAIFLNQKRVNVCEHMTRMASQESY